MFLLHAYASYFLIFSIIMLDFALRIIMYFLAEASWRICDMDSVKQCSWRDALQGIFWKTVAVICYKWGAIGKVWVAEKSEWKQCPSDAKLQWHRCFQIVWTRNQRSGELKIFQNTSCMHLWHFSIRACNTRIAEGFPSAM